jgi:hypothetical protein
VLLQLDIDALIYLNVHEMERGTALANHLQVFLIPRIIVAVQRAIIDAETVVPDVQDAFLHGLIATRSSGDGIAERIGDLAALDAIAA